MLQQDLIDFYRWRDLRYFLRLESKSEENIEDAVRSLECIEFDDNEENREDSVAHIWRPPTLVADWETRLAVSFIDSSAKKKIIQDPRAKNTQVCSTASYININCTASSPPPVYLPPAPLPLPEPPISRPPKKAEKKVRSEVNEAPPWIPPDIPPPSRGRPVKERPPNPLNMVPTSNAQLPNLGPDLPNFHYPPPPPPQIQHPPAETRHYSWQQKPIEWTRLPPPPEPSLRPTHAPTTRRGAKRGRPSDSSKRGRKPVVNSAPAVNSGSSMANLELVRVLQFLQKTYNH